MRRRQPLVNTGPNKPRTLLWTIVGIAVIAACAGNMTWVVFKLIHHPLSYTSALSIGTLLALVDAVSTYVNKRRVLLYRKEIMETRECL